MKKKIILVFLLLSNFLLFSQEISLSRVEPPFWWSGFKNRQLQLMIYGKNISTTAVSIKSPNVSLVRVNKVENPD